MNTARPPTAVIAEDEPVLARTLSRMLAQVWPELQVVGVAEDGPKAIELALERTPDVMFLDIRMPGRTGLEVAEMVADEWPLTLRTSSNGGITYGRCSSYIRLESRRFSPISLEPLIDGLTIGLGEAAVKRLEFLADVRVAYCRGDFEPHSALDNVPRHTPAKGQHGTKGVLCFHNPANCGLSI